MGRKKPSYYYESSNLVSVGTIDSKKYYLYNERNMLYAIIYNDLTYYYVRDILMNIIGIVDNNGKLMVKYTYDAFGKVITTTGDLKDTLGKDNPFIYKGYYYNFETSLYYCNSRYYVPDMR